MKPKIRVKINLPQMALSVMALVLAITINPWWLLLLAVHISSD